MKIDNAHEKGERVKIKAMPQHTGERQIGAIVIDRDAMIGPVEPASTARRARLKQNKSPRKVHGRFRGHRRFLPGLRVLRCDSDSKDDGCDVIVREDTLDDNDFEDWEPPEGVTRDDEATLDVLEENPESAERADCKFHFRENLEELVRQFPPLCGKETRSRSVKEKCRRKPRIGRLTMRWPGSTESETLTTKPSAFRSAFPCLRFQRSPILRETG